MTPYYRQTVRTVANWSDEDGFGILVLRDGRWTHYEAGMAVSEDEMRQITELRAEAIREKTGSNCDWCSGTGRDQGTPGYGCINCGGTGIIQKAENK